ncbi:ATPase MORC2 [Manis javanica]|nr:ATPase MORC2 [Manis javanica]
MSHATGQGEDVIAKLIRKVLYVGAFAYIIGNFNWLAGIPVPLLRRAGLTASGSTLSMENFLQPGRLAKLFITLIEFKLTTLAGFVLVPFALWNKTAFLAEKVLGNVVSSGIKVLVLAVIVGIGSGLFAEFQVQPAEPSIDHSVVVMLASLTLLALGIFGPGIATGLVSGGPQLGAGAMAGAALGAAGAAVAVGAAATGVGGAVAGARMAPQPPSWPVAERVPPLGPPAARGRRFRRVLHPPAAASRALPLVSAMSPRPARRRPGRRWLRARAR